jgi:hypothetical protein
VNDTPNPDAGATGRRRRRRFVPVVWIASLVALGVAALGVTGSLSGFTASIDNNANAAGTGSVVMKEVSGATTCYSTATGSSISTNASTCPTIDKLGGNLTMEPGTASESTVPVTITDIGTSPVTTSFTLTPGGCTASANGTPAGSDTAGFCGEVDVAIWDSTDGVCVVGPSGANSAGTCVPSSANTLASLGSTPLSLSVPVAAGGSKTFSILTEIDPGATNADMNLQAADSLTWTFNA